ncbi:MAG: toprim domain-containing protein, partial [Pseudobdellovibrionaceae bacterium]|nr:toprim domain-containing protein [Pseudobdellovibrionaceae bacterium]
MNSFLSDHHHELSELAAECGIDWPGTMGMIHGTGSYKNPSVINKKYRGKCIVFVEEKTRHNGQFFCITFFTKKHGGVSRTWTSHPKKGGAGLRSISSLQSTPDDDSKRREELHHLFKAAFAAAPKADSKHPYLVRKQIASVVNHADVRLLTDVRVFGRGSAAPYLCIPIRRPNGDYAGFQRIYPDGQKKLTTSLWDGQYKGAYALLGDPDQSRTIYVCEGFATAASIHEAAGMAVIVAISAGNLEAVTAHARSIFHGKRIVIVADNDKPRKGDEQKGNPGAYAALEAARKSKVAYVIIPSIEGRKTDANDYHMELGLDRLRDVLESQRQKPGKLDIQLLEIMAYARQDQLKSLVREYLRAAKVGYRVSVADAAELVDRASGGRCSAADFRKRAEGYLWKKRQRAQDLVRIKGADIYSSHKLEKDENHHWAIPEAAVEEIRQHRDRGRAVILKSPPGTGKTERVIKQLMGESERSALILPRIAVVNDASARLGIPNYNDLCPITAQFVEKVGACVNSMNATKFNSNGRNFFENLDALFLDECAQGFAQMVSLGSYGQKVGNTCAMIKSISSAGFVLVADAFANQYTFDCLRQMDNGRDIVVMDIEYPSEVDIGRDIEVSGEPTEVIRELLSAIRRGETAVFMSDSVKMARKVHELALKILDPGKILAVCREQSRAEKSATMGFTAAPNDHAKKYKLLIYTPKIDSGLSIT